MDLDRIPIINPKILPREANLPVYILFDSGISSQETIYNIAPAAKAKDIPIRVWDILPIIAPKKAPIPVVNPEIVAINIAFNLEEPLNFNGREIEIPSGTSCKAIAIASFNPKVEEDSKPAPIAKPSGKLCIAKPIAIIKPVFKRLFPCKLLWLLHNLLTKLSHKIIEKMPIKIPIIQ